MDLSFYKGKRVLVTGHTGFKGSWLIVLLNTLGAKVCGFSLAPETSPALYNILRGDSFCESHIGDIADISKLGAVFDKFRPEIVIHLAAQPLVLEGYERPVYTYLTNVMGTVNVLECARQSDSVKSILNVTTDKVYKNVEQNKGYRESDELCGYDPYSNSKSCSELVTYSYACSFLKGKGIAVSTARAGNVIGGGDFSANRIVPDCVRAATEKSCLRLRNPFSVRPYQHVLEPLVAYLTIAALQYTDAKYAGNYNIGPDRNDCVTTEQLVKMFKESWGPGFAYEASVIKDAPHEAGLLLLDNTKLKQTFGIYPVWNIRQAIQKTVEWTKAYLEGEDMVAVIQGQIDAFLKDGKNGRI